MSNLTIEIKANELTEAILTLAKALTNGGSVRTPFQQESITVPNMAPVQQFQPVQQMQQPVQQQPVQQQPFVAPTQQPFVAPAQQPVQQMQQPVQTIAPSYSTEQLAIAATQLVDAGKRNDLLSLLQGFGVGALTQLPKERFGEFATALRQMGAKL